MLSKPLTAVRVTNIDSKVQEMQICELFKRYNDSTRSNVVLCATSSELGSTQTATITFDSEAEAKVALKLNGTVLERTPLEIDTHFMGLTVLAGSSNAEVDIVALHGLNGHAYGTWTSNENENAVSGVMWLRDFLPQYIPKARIITYGYNSALLGSSTSVSTIVDFAHDLLQRILDQRTKEEKRRPLIFICHSLGGIVVKQLLVLAAAERVLYPDIWRVTHSILFLATPHGGSKSADLAAILSIITTLTLQHPAKQLLKTLKLDSDALVNLTTKFKPLQSNFNIVSFYERKKTPGINSLIVDRQSSLLESENERPIPIDATHSGVCKFSGPTHPLFTPVLAQIKACVEQAPVQISARFLGDQTNDLIKSIVTTRISHFIVPVSQNPQFLGREIELDAIDRYLTESDKERDSTYPIIAIHGLGGVGKTQIATEYVYRWKRLKPSTSIIWVSATSEDRIESQFIKIALELSKDLATDDDDPNYHHENTISSQAINTVIRWLSAADHKDWLFVFDNLDDIKVIIHRFLPVSLSGSVIITTRDRRLASSIASSTIELGEMYSLDAERLLLRSHGAFTTRNDTSWRTPETHPEYPAIKKIIQELHSFPLAVDQAAAFIRENAPLKFAEYLNYLVPRSQDRELLMRFKEVNPKYPESIMTTWEISLQHIEATHPRASEILQLLGFLDNTRISEKMLKAATKAASWNFAMATEFRKLSPEWLSNLSYLKDDAGFRLAIGVLVSLSLVSRDMSHSVPELSVHPLVHEWIRVRLKVTPHHLARLSISAAMVLYQSFPIGLALSPHDVIQNPYQELATATDEIVLHLRIVIENLKDYCLDSIEIPIECICLIGTICLFCSQEFGPSVSITMENEMIEILALISKKTNQSMQYLLDVLPFSFRWLREVQSIASSTNILSYIIKTLKSSDTVHICDEPALPCFLMVLTVVLRVYERLPRIVKEEGSDKMRMSLVGENARESESLRFRFNEAQRKLEVQILAKLQFQLGSKLDYSVLRRHIGLFVDYRLGLVANNEEYWRSSTKIITHDICSPSCPEASEDDLCISEYSIRLQAYSMLTHLSYKDRSAYLCLAIKLHFERSKYPDFERLMRLLDLAFYQCKEALDTELTLLSKQKPFSRANWSRHSYISSSGGRVGPFHEADQHFAENLSLPLDYIWRKITVITKAISDSNTFWASSSSESSSGRKLSLAERHRASEFLHHAIELSSMLRVQSGPNSVYFKVSQEELLTPLITRRAFLEIYVNLDEWTKTRRLLDSLLHCSAILVYCEEKLQTQAIQPSFLVDSAEQKARIKSIFGIMLELVPNSFLKPLRNTETYRNDGQNHPSFSLKHSVVVRREIQQWVEGMATGLPDIGWDTTLLPNYYNVLIQSYASELIILLIAYVEKKHPSEPDEFDQLKSILADIEHIKSRKVKYLTRLALVYYLTSKSKEDWHLYLNKGALENIDSEESSFSGYLESERPVKADDSGESSSIRNIDSEDFTLNGYSKSKRPVKADDSSSDSSSSDEFFVFDDE